MIWFDEFCFWGYLCGERNEEPEMPSKEFTYAVRGSWPFAADMLRYDGARGATPEDQAMIERLSAEQAPDLAAFEPVTINLIGARRPTYRRWSSMLWTVLEKSK